MKTFDIVLYSLWALVPLTMLGFAIWEKLEQWSSKRHEHQRAALEFLQNALFTSVMVLVAFLIDMYALEVVLFPLIPDFIPRDALRLLLLPVLLVVGAKIFGGSRPIRIEKAPTVSKNRIAGRKK